MNLTRDEQNEVMLAAVKRIRDEARLALEADPDDHEAIIRTVLAYCESVIRDVETSKDRPQPHSENKMKFDSKAYGVVRKVKDDSIIPDETWMLFQIKDNAFPATLRFYRLECITLGADVDQLAAVDRLIERMDIWRDQNRDKCKVPDAAGERLLDLQVQVGDAKPCG